MIFRTIYHLASVTINQTNYVCQYAALCITGMHVNVYLQEVQTPDLVLKRQVAGLVIGKACQTSAYTITSACGFYFIK